MNSGHNVDSDNLSDGNQNKDSEANEEARMTDATTTGITKKRDLKGVDKDRSQMR